jgi:hypothetical protein
MHESRTSSTSDSSTAACSSSSASATESTAASVTPSHPFAHAKGLLVVIPQDRVDVEEESAFYDEFDQQAFGVRVEHFGVVYANLLILSPFALLCLVLACVSVG